jgi:hypothetical protein
MANGDGGDAPQWSDVMASSRAGTRQAFAPFPRVLLSSFEGAVWGCTRVGGTVSRS